MRKQILAMLNAVNADLRNLNPQHGGPGLFQGHAPHVERESAEGRLYKSFHSYLFYLDHTPLICPWRNYVSAADRAIKIFEESEYSDIKLKMCLEVVKVSLERILWKEQILRSAQLKSVHGIEGAAMIVGINMFLPGGSLWLRPLLKTWAESKEPSQRKHLNQVMEWYQRINEIKRGFESQSSEQQGPQLTYGPSTK